MFNKKLISDIDVKGKRVLVRVDYNVPIKDGKVADDTRIRAALPTMQYLLDHGAAVILCSHLGRPKDGPDPKYSMRPTAEHLAELLGKPVAFAEDCIGPLAEKAAGELKAGRGAGAGKHPLLQGRREKRPADGTGVGNPGGYLCQRRLWLSAPRPCFHRRRGAPPAGSGGFLMEKEIQYLGQAIADPKKPFVAILGGAKDQR